MVKIGSGKWQNFAWSKPDAHNKYRLLDIKYGVNIARKGALSKKLVLNTLPVHEVQEKLKLK